MLNNCLYGAALAAALVACPAVAEEASAPGCFSLPGTDTKIKPYGLAYLNGWYFRDQDLGDTGALVAGHEAPPLGAETRETLRRIIATAGL